MVSSYQLQSYLIGELERINYAISSLESKKARLDRVLEHNDALTRKQKRKMKQSLYLTVKSLDNVRREQTMLVQNLHGIETEIRGWQQAEMSFLMAQSQYNSFWAPPQIQYYLPAIYPQPNATVDISREARGSEPQWLPDWDNAMMQLDQATLVQDFTHPQETVQPEVESTESVPSRPDSGFEEPPLYMMPFDLPINYDASQHVYAHELFYQPGSQAQPPIIPQPGTVIPSQIFAPRVSAMPVTLDDMVSPRTTEQPYTAPLLPGNLAHDDIKHDPQAMARPSRHTRGQSEAAVELIERRLSESQNMSRHMRNKSSGDVSVKSEGSSTYSPAAYMQGHRASLSQVEQGEICAANAEVEWLG